MGRFSVIFAGTLGMVAVVGCAFKPSRETPGGMGGNSSATGGATVTDDGAVFRPDAAIEYITADADTEAGPTVDANCGNVPFMVVVPPPELLIVLDRSGSMYQDAAGVMQPAPYLTTKWFLMTEAINMAVAMSEKTVNWGLKFFGTGTTNNGNGACVVDDVVAVPPGPMNAAAIKDAIALPANQPITQTPTRLGVMQAGTYMMGRATQNPKYILLATDGVPNCGTGNTDAPAAIAAVGAVAALGIPTFVIGIAADTVAGTTLDAMAVMGGKPLVGPPQYYSVATTMDLVNALNAIQGSVVGMCTYPVGAQDPMTTDLTKISVTVDGSPSMRDDPNGWIYDPGMTSITFQGTTCSQLMARTLTTVQILFGCQVGPIK